LRGARRIMVACVGVYHSSAWHVCVAARWPQFYHALLQPGRQLRPCHSNTVTRGAGLVIAPAPPVPWCPPACAGVRARSLRAWHGLVCAVWCGACKACRTRALRMSAHTHWRPPCIRGMACARVVPCALPLRAQHVLWLPPLNASPHHIGGPGTRPHSLLACSARLGQAPP
jgi:hypothetical protein